MHGTILVYGNEEMLVTTRALILESAGNRTFTANQFGNAMLVLMNHQIDIVVLCQSLKDEERRGILETARAIQPDIKCLILDFAQNQLRWKERILFTGCRGLLRFSIQLEKC
jgi:hypothetical protein